MQRLRETMQGRATTLSARLPDTEADSVVTGRRRVRVLVVDDSALVRQALSRILSRDPAIEVVGVAGDAYAARDKVVELQPDVLTLDIHMPRMDGVTFLKRLMIHRPTPVVVISGVTAAGTREAVEALAAGALQIIEKPSASVGMSEIATKLIAAVKAAAITQIGGYTNHPAADLGKDTIQPLRGACRSATLLALGASTGGVAALTEVLSSLPADAPPVVVVQHMPPRFTASFAERLGGICSVSVKEAADGDTVGIGEALIAPGGRHMRVQRFGNGYRVAITDEDPVSHQRPSVNVLFESVAKNVGPPAIAALLTGMGDDGAEGMLRIRQAGGRTIAQDRDSCVVFGMPAAAISLGAAERTVPLNHIAATLIDMARTKSPDATSRSLHAGRRENS